MTAQPPPPMPQGPGKTDNQTFDQSNGAYPMPPTTAEYDPTYMANISYAQMQAPNPYYANQGYVWPVVNGGAPYGAFPQHQHPHPQQQQPQQQQQQYPQQAHLPYVPQHNGRSGYPNGYNARQGGYPQLFPQQFYPGQFPQMGGPGPATMQNGYGGGGGYPGVGGGAYFNGAYPQVPFDPSQPPYGDPMRAMNGGAEYPDASQLQGDPGYGFRQQQQHPYPNMAAPPYPNGNAAAPYPPYQQYPGYVYPGQPDGLPPPHTAPYPPGPPPQHLQPHQQQQSPQQPPNGHAGPNKSLNPTAQGFSFASSASSTPNGRAVDPPLRNPPLSPRRTEQNDSKPLVPSGSTEADDQRAKSAAPNGDDKHASSENDLALGAQARNPADEYDHQQEPAKQHKEEMSLLGLTQMDGAGSTDVGSITVAMPAPPKEHVDLTSDSGEGKPTSTPAETQSANAEQAPQEVTDRSAHIVFAGSPISNMSSPPSTSISQRLPDPVVVATPSKDPKKPAVKAAGIQSIQKMAPSASVPAPLQLVRRRPDAGAVDGTVFARALARSIPSSQATENVSLPRAQDEAAARTSTRTRAQTSAVVCKTRSRKYTTVAKCAFGSISPEEAADIVNPVRVVIPAAVQPTTMQTALPTSVSQTPAPAPTPAPASAPAVPPTKAAAPKPKPASWAALLQPAHKPSAATAPVPAAVSKAVSPTHSTISLDAPQPAVPVAEADAPSTSSPAATPVSVSASTLPATPLPAGRSAPPSTGASAPKAPRPAFNYAAAAAAGSAISPAEETAQILSEGLKVRSREAKDALVLPRGFINTGNMCFANTVLVYCQPFNELLSALRSRLKADLARKTPFLEATMSLLTEFEAAPGTVRPPPSLPASASASGTSTPVGAAQNGRSARKDALVPTDIYEAMKVNKRFESMRRGFQEDAEEFLGFFLTTLHEEMLDLLSRTHVRSNAAAQKPAVNGDTAAGAREVERPVSPGAEGGDGWLEVGKKQKTNVVRKAESTETAITRLFGGTIRSVLHTPGQKDSVTLEPYQPLQLDIQDPSVLTIVDALKGLSVPETIPVFNSVRKETVDATKTVYIEAFPPVLILHLKRFVYDPAEHNVVKRGKAIAYGTELVIPSEAISPAKRSAGPVKYKLFGVIYHHGASATGGHYTIAAARSDGKGWNHFDDEMVTPMPADQVIISPEEAAAAQEGSRPRLLVGGRERCAYLLFWQRVR